MKCIKAEDKRHQTLRDDKSECGDPRSQIKKIEKISLRSDQMWNKQQQIIVVIQLQIQNQLKKLAISSHSTLAAFFFLSSPHKNKYLKFSFFYSWVLHYWRMFVADLSAGELRGWLSGDEEKLHINKGDCLLHTYLDVEQQLKHSHYTLKCTDELLENLRSSNNLHKELSHLPFFTSRVAHLFALLLSFTLVFRLLRME